MAWCFSTRASVATVLSTHPCVSSYSWVDILPNAVMRDKVPFVLHSKYHGCIEGQGSIAADDLAMQGARA